MKIAFIGSHGVGKTILCYDLASMLRKMNKTVSIVSEIAREAAKSGFLINENTTVNAQGWILFIQMAKELEGKNDSEYVICDRSVIDNYMYMRIRFGPQQFYEDLIMDWLKYNSYDFLFKVPPLGELQKDGVRSVVPEFQKKIDEELTKFLAEKEINVISLPETDDKDQWLLEVKRILFKDKTLDEFS